MPFYLTQATFSRDTIKVLIANPQDRAEPIAKVLEAVGGKLHHYFFAFGDYDAAVLFEAPDNQSAAAAVMAVGSGGALTTQKTTVLMTMDEAVASMKQAGSVSGDYRPPAR
jgi:uncharacterized protein with GYD domain